MPQRDPQFDVLVVGAGAAGLYAALSLPAHLRVGLLAKDQPSYSASGWAQGGMAAAISPEDSPALHAQDTIAAGMGLCEPAAVNFLVTHAAAQVERLLEMGIAFDRRGTDLALTLEAAHRLPRVLHAADTTGKELVATLMAQVQQRANIQIFPSTLTLNLWQHPQTGACQGLCLMRAGTIEWWPARVVVLATGGGGQVFAQTTNPSLSTGDGVAMAWRGGAQLRDLEFVQFHPTALTVPGAPRFLISEAVRGEGGQVIDTQGRRFLFDTHSDGELAPRDVVSRAIYTHLQATGAEHVWLDLRPIPAAQIQKRFPKIIQVCQKWGIDVFTQPIPVAPAAHYWMGGIITDLKASTSIPSLYAVGEVSSTGVHGANRLASNSLLECLVFAAQLAKIPLPDLKISYPESPAPTLFAQPLTDLEDELARIQTIRQQLPQLMWQSAGIARQASTLTTAIRQIDAWQQEWQQLALTQIFANLTPGQSGVVDLPTADKTLRLWSETQNLLDIAGLILKSAHFRCESRGGHYRNDYPQSSASWQVHTLVQAQTWQPSPLGSLQA